MEIKLMNQITVQNFLVLTFISFFSSSLIASTKETSQKKSSHTISERNINKTYDGIIDIFLKLCTAPCCYAQPRQEASAVIKKAKNHGLLKDLLSYQTLQTGNTLLHLALENNCTEVAFVLLLNSDQENLSILNAQGKAAIHIAVILDNPDLITTFHSKQPDCFLIKDKQDRLPLHYAVEHNALNIIDLMIALEATVINAQDKQGNTPAHLCSHATILKTFQNHEANFTLKNQNGISVQNKLVDSFEESSKKFISVPDCTIL